MKNILAIGSVGLLSAVAIYALGVNKGGENSLNGYGTLAMINCAHSLQTKHLNKPEETKFVHFFRGQRVTIPPEKLKLGQLNTYNKDKVNDLLRHANSPEEKKDPFSIVIRNKHNEQIGLGWFPAKPGKDFRIEDIHGLLSNICNQHNKERYLE